LAARAGEDRDRPRTGVAGVALAEMGSAVTAPAADGVLPGWTPSAWEYVHAVCNKRVPWGVGLVVGSKSGEAIVPETLRGHVVSSPPCAAVAA
jgi:hypothetical protein